MARKHFKCWLWKILWSFAGLSLVLSWGGFEQGVVATLPVEMWLWNSLVLGVLAISVKLDCHDCSVCNV